MIGALEIFTRDQNVVFLPVLTERVGSVRFFPNRQVEIGGDELIAQLAMGF